MRAFLCACVCVLAYGAPAAALVDVRTTVGPVDANVTADPTGVGVGANAGPVQADVTVPLPETPVTPPPVPPVNTPSVPDVGGTVDQIRDTANDATGNAVPDTGAGRSDPAAPSSGGGSAGSGGSGEPRGNGGGGTDTTGRRPGGDGGSGDGRRGGREGRDRRGDGVAADDAPGGSAVALGADPTSTRTEVGTDDRGGVTRTLETVVEVIPVPIWIAMGLLALLAAVFFGRGQIIVRRARRLAEHRRELLRDVGLLQQALLPEIPEKLGELATSVAYRPADGPAAGGDFYDAFLLDGERVAIIVGDVSGHGRAALARTALMRYTLRAYLDAGLEPRRALKVAGRALDDDLGGDFATVVVAVHDPAHATLTYSSAGHPPPIVTGSGAFEPVTALSSPPIGAGQPTGQRQTTLHLPRDAVACFFTDGLVEAKIDGDLVGREKLADLLSMLGPEATANGVIDAVANYADATPDDMAACVLRPDATGAADHVPDRVEEVELNAVDIAGDRVERYLAACGVAPEDAAAALKSVEASVGEYGGALLRVRVDKTGTYCEVESARGLHDPLGPPHGIDDVLGRAADPSGQLSA